MSIKRIEFLGGTFPEDHAVLEKEFKRRFPDRALPYQPKELTEIAKFLYITGHDQRARLRYELRYLAYETLQEIENRYDITPGDIRSTINDRIIPSIDALTEALNDIQRIGGNEAYASANEKGHHVNIHLLIRDLSKFRKWSMLAREQTYSPNVSKGETEIRQNFVDRLYEIYHTFSGKTPTRSPQSDQKGRWFNDGEFSRFVDTCAKPIFDKPTNFDRQIRHSQKFKKDWLAAGQNHPD